MAAVKKILILEDEPDINEMYGKFLKNKGYRCANAFNGVEGLEKLKTFVPDLIMLDLNMPEMGGVEFYQKICDANGRPRYPVLVITGRYDMEKLFRDFNVDGFVCKPFGGERLLVEIEAILKRQYYKKTDGAARRVIIVDQDKAALERIRTIFTTAGYAADVAENATFGIEKISANPPDLALINLGLTDVPGDLVVFKLQQMAKTKDVNFLLYVAAGDFHHHQAVMNNMSTKSGVKLMQEYTDPAQLLDAAVEVFQKVEEK